MDIVILEPGHVRPGIAWTGDHCNARRQQLSLAVFCANTGDPGTEHGVSVGNSPGKCTPCADPADQGAILQRDDESARTIRISLHEHLCLRRAAFDTFLALGSAEKSDRWVPDNSGNGQGFDNGLFPEQPGRLCDRPP